MDGGDKEMHVERRAITTSANEAAALQGASQGAIPRLARLRTFKNKLNC